MRRVMILGPCGSGKSTLARRIGAQHNLPVFHLDQFFHQPGWVPAPAPVFQAEVERIAALPGWVIDGNYTSTETLAPRLAVADTIFYLDIPSWLSMLRVLRRMASSYGKVRGDMAPGCPERLDLEFLRYVWTWNRIRRARSLALLKRFKGAKFIVTAAGRRLPIT